MDEYILSSLSNTGQRFERMALEFLPRLIAMLIITVLGWIVALVLRLALRYLLRIFKFNRLCESAGLTQMLAKAALPPPTNYSASWYSGWSESPSCFWASTLSIFQPYRN